ncbi:methionine import ATP-binding protein MetN [Aureimonas endophytica]|uniref:Cell division ATP-binding protein FtsE n=1 Tax=Aureimonas endophytica TaxID=2027858 RepID=A0A917E1C8_9HYPH|nr:methionine ABC transporter ATP-binding protein [Aureimonas endophytica]GGD91729.1 methionine import ATP-binding protein MetN [Aureimonas endophytica]
MNQHVPTARLEADVAPASEIVRLVDVRRRFGATQALGGISLGVAKGEILGIIGRSGAGKSTLIRCLNGLERPDSGRIEIEGRDIAGLAEAELQPLRRRVGMVFQHFNLLAAKTVAENVGLPLKIAGEAKAKRATRVAELLDLVGLAEKAEAYPAQLSGGQKQRVGIARALAAHPALLLSDEATSALDPETTRQILALLKDINRRLGVTIVLITHEMEVVRAIADRVAVIEAGRIVEEGPVWRVFARPETDLTRSLLAGIRPELPAEIAGRLSPAPGAFAVVRADLVGAGAGTLLGDLAAATGRTAELLHGGIDQIQGRPVASLFLKIPAQGESLAEARRVLDARGGTTEVLGYV